MLTIGARCQTKQLGKDFDLARDKVKGFASRIPGVGQALSLFSKAGLTPVTIGLAAVAAGAIAAVAAFKLLKSAFARIRQEMGKLDSIAKTASKLDMTTESLIALHHASTLSGVSIQTTNMALQRMVKNVAKAAVGTGEAKGAIKQLGLDAAELTKLRPDAMFGELADALNKVGSQGDKIRILQKIVDSEGVALINTMKGGTEGLNAALADTQRLWTSATNVDTAKSEMAEDAMYRLGEVFHGLAVRSATALAPALTEIATLLTDVSLATRDTATEMDTMGPAASAVAASVSIIVNQTRQLVGLLMALSSAAKVLNLFDLRFFDNAKEATEDLRRAKELMAAPAFDAAEWYTEVNNKYEKLAQEQQQRQTELATSMREQLAVAEIAKSANTLIDKYKSTAQTFNMTSRQAEIFKLAMKGANREMIQQAQHWDRLLTQQEKHKEGLDKWKRQQKDSFDSWKRVQDQGTATVKDFRTQILALKNDWTPRQVTIHRQEQAGLNKEMVRYLQLGDRILTNLEEEKKKRDELRQERDRKKDEKKNLAQSIVESSKTALQKYEEIKRKVADIVRTDPNVSRKQGVAYLREQAETLGLIKDKEEEIQRIRFGAAAEAGSKEAREIMQGHDQKHKKRSAQNRCDLSKLPRKPPRI
jgi:hypothetical protein